MQNTEELRHVLVSSFEDVADPRAANAHHSLEKVLLVVVVGLFCGADGFVQIERVAKMLESVPNSVYGGSE